MTDILTNAVAILIVSIAIFVQVLTWLEITVDLMVSNNIKFALSFIHYRLSIISWGHVIVYLFNWCFFNPTIALEHCLEITILLLVGKLCDERFLAKERDFSHFSDFLDFRLSHLLFQNCTDLLGIWGQSILKNFSRHLKESFGIGITQKGIFWD